MRICFEHPDVSDASLAPCMGQSLVDELVLVVIAENLGKNQIKFINYTHEIP